MGSAKPCLGYPSRTAACRAMNLAGIDNREIAKRIGISTTTVSSLLCSSKTYRVWQAKPAVRSYQQLDDASVIISNAVNELVPHHMRELLRHHAVKRRTTTQRLIQAIIDKVIEDDLVDAVLDDAETIAGGAPCFS